MKDNNDALNKITYLQLDYDNFILLLELIKAYVSVDKNSLPGITGEKVHKLYKILVKFNDKYKEVVELQEKLNITLKEYFEGNVQSIGGYWGSTNYHINNYKIDTNFVLELTIEEIFVLYYYTDLFKEYKHKGMLIFPKDHIVFKEIDNILRCIEKCILTRIPSKITFCD
jgi:hypothetical protein